VKIKITYTTTDRSTEPLLKRGINREKKIIKKTENKISTLV
jgi:hypothetical protein